MLPHQISLPQALSNMLDKELWRHLPTPGGGAQGSLREAFTNEGPAAGGPSPAQSPRPSGQSDGRTRTFEQWLAAGNPWRGGAHQHHCTTPLTPLNNTTETTTQHHQLHPYCHV